MVAIRFRSVISHPHGELFRLDEVSVDADGHRILDDLTLAVPDRGFTVLAGPSGAGKTRLLRLLNRLDAPTEGTVSRRGVDLASIDAATLRRDVAMIFQHPPRFAGTVADNRRVAARDLSESAIGATLERVELSRSCADQDAATLSIGEAQRMCFARALLCGPTTVLADEPTSALDEAPKRALEDFARRLVDSGVAVVWVSHDAAQIHRVADHVIVIAGGRLMAEGPPDELVDDANPLVRSVLEARR